MERGGCVYIMSNQYRTTLYIGVSSNLPARIWEHVNHAYPKSFTARFKLHHCVYYESFFSIEESIAKEKELKGWKRERKNVLINSMNPTWQDLSEEIINW